MFDLATALDLLGTGVKVYGAIAGGRDQQDAYNALSSASLAEARRALLNAREVQDVAQQQAAVTRRSGLDVQSSARAAYGASGVNVNYGTAKDVQREIGTRVEEDALNAILLGERQSRRLEDVATASVNEASQFVRAGKNARSTSDFNAVGSIISGGASAWSKWNAGQPILKNNAPIQEGPS